MSNKDFVECLEFVLKYEGGFVENPHDPGGVTNYGITRNVLAAWRGHPVSISDMKNINKNEVSEIYQRNYWMAAGCDRLGTGDNLVVFDAAVNNGVGRALEWKYSLIKPSFSNKDFISNFTNLRLKFDRGLKVWRYFSKGWSARIEACQKLADQMAIRSTIV
jgi:lysozyme family protein